MIRIRVMFNVAQNHLTILPADEHSRLWQEKADPDIGILMRGLSEEQPFMTDNLLGEIAQGIGRLAAMTGEQVRVRYGTGHVEAHIPLEFRPGVAQILEDIKQARM